MYSRLEVNKGWFEVKDMPELMPLVQAQSDNFKTLLKYTLPKKTEKSQEDSESKAKDTPGKTNSQPEKSAPDDGLNVPGDLP